MVVTAASSSESMKPSSRACSLTVGLRISHGVGVIMENSRCSSACSFTSDWRKMTDLVGSSPALSQSITISSVFSRRPAALVLPVVSACQSATK